MQIYGRQELATQIEDITGQKIDHVAKITFGGLTGVVDALGGIELCYDQDVDDELSDLHWKPRGFAGEPVLFAQAAADPVPDAKPRAQRGDKHDDKCGDEAVAHTMVHRLPVSQQHRVRGACHQAVASRCIPPIGHARSMPLFQEVTMTNDEGHGLPDTPPSFAPKPRRKATVQDAQGQPAPPSFAPHSRRSPSSAGRCAHDGVWCADARLMVWPSPLPPW